MGRRWAVLVTAHDVRGCTGTFRWRWRARLEAHSKLRYWPGPKVVEIAQIDGERIVDGDEVYPGGEDPEWHKIKLAIRLVRQLRRLSGRRHDSIVKRRDSDMTQDAESVRVEPAFGIDLPVRKPDGPRRPLLDPSILGDPEAMALDPLEVDAVPREQQFKPEPLVGREVRASDPTPRTKTLRHAFMVAQGGNE